MVTTARVKAQKKQPAFIPHTDADVTRRMEQAALDLEDAVIAVLEADKGHAFHDVDFLYWDRKIKNIATPVSLALNEYKGPRRFHFHYRHDPKDYDTMVPVLEPSPLATLAKVCRDAVIKCDELVGISDRTAARVLYEFERSLKMFIAHYAKLERAELGV